MLCIHFLQRALEIPPAVSYTHLIDGFSEATLEKFIDHGWLQKVTDIFSLSQYKEEIQNLDGFGEKSYTNLIQAIEDSKQVTLERVIYSLGIKGIGSVSYTHLDVYKRQWWNRRKTDQTWAR